MRKIALIISLFSIFLVGCNMDDTDLLEEEENIAVSGEEVGVTNNDSDTPATTKEHNIESQQPQTRQNKEYLEYVSSLDNNLGLATENLINLIDQIINKDNINIDQSWIQEFNENNMKLNLTMKIHKEAEKNNLIPSEFEDDHEYLMLNISQVQGASEIVEMSIEDKENVDKRMLDTALEVLKKSIDERISIEQGISKASSK